MRSFISSLIGRIVSQAVVAALLLPSITVSSLAAKATAQTVSQPVWAVVDLKNEKSAGTKFGEFASEALSSALARTNRYDPRPRETVLRAIETLGLIQPIPNVTSLLRVGQELQASTIVGGEIVNYRIDSSSAGKVARVSMRVVCYDVASGLPVNGAAVSASSTVRSGNVSEETLINDAITVASSVAVDKIQTQTLPEATVLNTYEQSALINQGTRTGFKSGMRVIITRGKRQVATAEVVQASPTNSTIRIGRSDLGLNPGDKVRAVFDVPMLAGDFNPTGEASVKRSNRSTNGSGILSVLLIVGLLAFLLTGQNGSSQEVLQDVRAEAVDDPTNGPAVQINWSPNAFAKSNFQRVAWQIFRNDNLSVPVRIANGIDTGFLDNTVPATQVTFTNYQRVGGLSCDNTAYNNQTGTTSALIPGRPYQYSVELVYGLNRIDLPDGGGQNGGLNGGGLNGGGLATGGGGGLTTGGQTTGVTTGATAGTTGTTTTGTTTGGTSTGSTAGNTGGGGTGGAQGICYFVTARTPSQGYATPLTPSQLIAPAPNATLQTAQTFSFTSVNTFASIRFPAFYQLQVSTSPTFSPVWKRDLFTRNDIGSLATDPIDFNGTDVPDFIRNARELYWRIGARNSQDRPGPLADPLTRERLIFSIANRIVKPGTPPPPPAN